MSDPHPDTEARNFAAESASLWRITFAPVIWAVHFAVSYAATAIVCARFAGPADQLGTLRGVIAGLTVLALAAIAVIGARSWISWDLIDNSDYEAARAESRHAFLGHISFLLSIVSAIGVVFVALPIVVLATCR